MTTSAFYFIMISEIGLSPKGEIVKMATKKYKLLKPIIIRTIRFGVGEVGQREIPVGTICEVNEKEQLLVDGVVVLKFWTFDKCDEGFNCEPILDN